MAGASKTYFLFPTRDCPPSGPIAIGSIITSPLSPEMPLNPPLPIDRAVMPISAKHEDNWKIVLEKHKNGRVGIWSSFCQVLGAGADVSFNWDLSSTNAYQFERLETHTFWPTKAYVEKSVTAAPVQAFLAGKRFHHNVYMITAIKVAFGASGAQAVLRKRGVHVHLGVDGTNSGVPISAGPQGDVGWGERNKSSFEGGSGFVFAFRLREICYTTKRGVVEREFTKGALFGLEDEIEHKEGGSSDDAIEDRDMEEEEQFELLGLAEADVHGKDVDEDGQEVEDESGEECECVWPERQ